VPAPKTRAGSGLTVRKNSDEVQADNIQDLDFVEGAGVQLGLDFDRKEGVARLTITPTGVSSDVHVEVTASDTNPSGLDDKLGVTAPISKVTENAGGNELLRVSHGGQHSFSDILSTISDSQHGSRGSGLHSDSHAAITLSAEVDAFLSLASQALDLDLQAANTLFAGPASGSAKPTFRTLVADDYVTMVGDSGAGGTKGAVPAPAVGDATKFLRGDATWAAAGGGSGHTIRENGTDQTARTGLNFIDANAGVGLITDDLGGDETEVNLNLYVLLGVGRAGGSTLYGGNAANENLILGGTSHATHTTSIISMLDHIRLASGKVVQDSGGNTRLTLSTSSPHSLLTGDAQVSGLLGVGGAPVAGSAVAIVPAAGTITANFYALQVQPGVQTIGAAALSIYALAGIPQVNLGTGGYASSNVEALNFTLALTGGSGTATLAVGACVDASIQLVAANATITDLFLYRAGTFQILSPGASLSITNTYGLYLPSIGVNAKQVNTISLRILDQGTTPTGNQYLMEIGPATPYFRVLAIPTAVSRETPLFISWGTAAPAWALKQLKTKDGAAIGAGDEVCILV